jgi:phosphoglycerate-specific signal transduction histidine kinase
MVIWVRVSTAQAPEPGSSLRGIPTVIEDITERKRAEDALQEARDALLRVSRVTTLGELSASIAHEINQPLGAIVANGSACLRLLAAEKLDLEEARETVEDIINDGRRASAVLGRVRQLAKKPRRNGRRSTSTAPSRRCCPSPARSCNGTKLPRRPTSIRTCRLSWPTGFRCSKSCSISS